MVFIILLGLSPLQSEYHAQVLDYLFQNIIFLQHDRIIGILGLEFSFSHREQHIGIVLKVIILCLEVVDIEAVAVTITVGRQESHVIHCGM